ncbi:unnamed protein product [Cochlearia groenlandica]
MVKAVEQEREIYKSTILLDSDNNVKDKMASSSRKVKRWNSDSNLRIEDPDIDDGTVFKKVAASNARPTLPFRPLLSKEEPPQPCETTDEELQEEAEKEEMKERFAKLLLGEDMSGGGQGVSSALALSNAIANLSASVFGEEQRRLEPVSKERKERWRREMGWFLSVTDHIVEFSPTQQTNKDGSSMEVMTTKQRTDLVSNIPSLKNLDMMLIDCLDKFEDQDEYYYITTDSSGFENNLPAVKVPCNGLSKTSKKFLLSQKDCVSQVLKSAMAINTQVLSEMEIPESYIDSLPKKGKACLGDMICRMITLDMFDAEQFLLEMDLSSEHKILDLKNRIEASVVIWRRKMVHKDGKSSPWSTNMNMEKRQLLEERAETISHLIKQRFPRISQSTLDISKIQFNNDIGLAILESYSRVLESLAHTVMSRIEDVLEADKITQDTETAVCKRYIVKEPESPKKLEKPNYCLLEEKPKKQKAAISLSEVMQWTIETNEQPKKEKFDTPFKESGKKLLTRVSSMIMANNKKSTTYLESLGTTKSPTAGRYS